ncbi:recombinase family protein [Methylomonas montana]
MALIGYARVSTTELDTALQTDALSKVGCKQIFEDTVSGAKAEHPCLAAAAARLKISKTDLCAALQSASAADS